MRESMLDKKRTVADILRDGQYASLSVRQLAGRLQRLEESKSCKSDN
jgi:hypothetical protein